MKNVWISIIALVIIVALAFAGYKYFKHKNQSVMMPYVKSQVTPAISPTLTPSSTTSTNTALPTGNSNSDLDQDVNSIQGNLNTINTDQNSINQLPTSDQVPAQ